MLCCNGLRTGKRLREENMGGTSRETQDYTRGEARRSRTLISTRSCGEEVDVNSETVKANKYVDILGDGLKRVCCQSSSIILESEEMGRRPNRNRCILL